MVVKKPEVKSKKSEEPKPKQVEKPSVGPLCDCGNPVMEGQTYVCRECQRST